MTSRAIPLDGSNTRVSFAVAWWGFLTVRGTFPRIKGELRISEGDLPGSSLALDVEAGSVTTGISLRDHHLRGPRFLDAKRYPLIAFRSARVERVDGAITVAGRLTLKGIEREVITRVPLGIADGYGRDAALALGATFAVPRIPHNVGTATGIHAFNPLLVAIARDVRIDVSVTVPANRLLPALLPALGR